MRASPKPRSGPRRNPTPSRQKSPPAPTAKPERLQKLLAAAGLGSRREIETWIAAGRLTLNGRLAKLGESASRADDIRLDGKPITLHAQSPARVLLYHKPAGELVTRRDPEGRATVFERLPAGRWIAVGRLDLNSSGLILFTDSGELANRLMHPRYGVEREYLARVRGALTAAEQEKLRTGVELDGEPARFERIDVERRGEGTNVWYRVVLREGRKREVRRLFEALGHAVSRLVRIRYGAVRLPADLAPGRWREMSNPAILQRF
jgi:23S rRNA pseudouridine2605 synthase